jgi:hypothetical protein
MPNLLVTALNAGELSPYMDARTDVEKYRTGCRRLENMIVLPYGGVYRRAGTEYLGEAKLGNKRCRLIGFNFSVTTRFVLEFGDQYLRVWGNNGPVLSGGTPLELASPYLEAELREIQYVQVNDIMYLAHANHAPRKLTRVADDNWTLTTVQWDYPPVLDQNITPVTIASSAATGTATLTASASTFQSGHVGSQWAIQWPRTSGAINENNRRQQDVNNHTRHPRHMDADHGRHGGWAQWRLLRIPRKEMDEDGGAGFTAYEVVREFNSLTTARNFTATGTEGDRVGLKLQILNYVSNTSARVFLESTDFNSGGTVTISSVASGTSSTATVDKWLGSTITATAQWSEAAFSAVRGYPRAVAIHEQRLCFAGTTHQPNTVWCSQGG